MRRSWLLWVVGVLLCHAFPVYASHPAHLSAGAQAMKEEDQGRAMAFFSRVIDAPDTSRAERLDAFTGRCASRYKQSFVRAETAWVQQAIDDCSQAIALRSDHQRAYRLRGAALLTLGRLDQALSDLDIAVLLDPNDYLSMKNRGLVKANQNRLDAAIVDFDAAIRLNPTHPWSYDNRGQLHAALSRHNKAVADFDLFIRLKKDYAPVYVHRGKSLMLTEQYPQAVADFQEALRLNPAHDSARTSRGITLFFMGKYGEAAQDLRASLQKSPHSIEGRVWLFLNLARQKKSGREAFSGAFERLPPDQWPGVVPALLLGRISDDAALDVVQNVKDEEMRRKQTSLILFLLGERALLHNRPNDAKHWFQQIRMEQHHIPTILHAAHHELRKLYEQQAKGVSPLSSGTGGGAALSSGTGGGVAVSSDTGGGAAVSSDTGGGAAVSSGTGGGAAVSSDKKAAAVTSEPPLPASAPVSVLVIPKPPPLLASASHSRTLSASAVDSTLGLTAETKAEIDMLVARRVTRNPHTKGEFAFKLGSFRYSANADRALADATRMKFRVYIQAVPVGQERHIRVWVGPFKTHAAAEKARRRLALVPGYKPDPVRRF